MDSKDKKEQSHFVLPTSDYTPDSDELVNASGHIQELKRHYNLLSLAGIGITVGNVWPAAGGSILVALYNGGSPGVLYEFVVVSIFYWIVALSLAELASAIPSSAGVYHWASVTPGKRWGPINGYFAGWWNYLAWVFGAASMSSIFGNTVVQMYALNHPDFVAGRWHVFVVYVIVTWLACLSVCFFNRAMPWLNTAGIFFILAGFLITVIVLAVMPGHEGRPPHATSSFVWSEWTADIGYPDGFVFVAGMLNGAYSVGVPDVVSHLSEEIPDPARNVPIAIGLQMALGFVTGFAYLVVVMYAINDYDALFEAPYPIAEIYRQGTGSAAAATGLLFLALVCIGICLLGLYITSGRTLWTLARDRATPFPNQLSKIHPKLDVPIITTLLTAVLVTVLGCIYLGSLTAFNAFVGSFVIMSSSSYIAAILPHLITGRNNIRFGTFSLNKGPLGYICNAVACVYMVVWFVIYCFPFSLPTNAATMNYASLLWGGLTVLLLLWWFAGARKGYRGPTATGGQTGVDLMKVLSQTKSGSVG